jgi:hypothetical protein
MLWRPATQGSTVSDLALRGTAVGKNNNVTDAVLIGDLDNALADEGAVARPAFGKTAATTRQDVIAGFLK